MRHRSVALVTRDPGLYHELAGFLRERRWPVTSLFPGDRIPDHVTVVLTSPEEARLISHRNVIAVSEGGDRRVLGAAVAHALGMADPGDSMIVGIDPGPRPGYAIFAGPVMIGQGVLESPEATGTFSVQLRHRFSGRHLLFRVGTGDPPTRNRIVNSLLEHHRAVELVDEQGTTPRGHRRPRDPEAARTIALSRGHPVRERLAVTTTPGEIANLQRLSREGSDGRVTISRASAHRVLVGELTLAEALDQAMAPRATPPAAPRPAARRAPAHEPI